MYGCENWILTDSLLKKLDSCIGGMAKRVLCWPRHFSNTLALTVLGVSSARVWVLLSKLRFLRKCWMDNAVGVGAVVMNALEDDVESISLIRECRELEDFFGTNYTDMLLRNEMLSMKEVKKNLQNLDRERRLLKCSKKCEMIEKIEKEVSWKLLWEKALDLGLQHTKGLQYLSRLMSHHLKGDKPCPLCTSSGEEIQESTLLAHVLSEHKSVLKINLNLFDLLQRVTTFDIFFVHSFCSFFDPS